MFKVFLVERRVIGIVASFRLSPQHVIHPGKPGPASSRTEVLFSFVVHVSVAYFSLRGGGAGPTLDPPPFSQRAWDRQWRSSYDYMVINKTGRDTEYQVETVLCIL